MDVDQLRQVALFANLTEDQLGWLTEKMTETEVAAGTYLVKEGDYAYRLFTILEGSFEVTREGQHIATLGQGESFGEMSLEEDLRRNADVLALTSARLATLMSWDYREALRRMPKLKEAVDRLTTQRER